MHYSAHFDNTQHISSWHAQNFSYEIQQKNKLNLNCYPLELQFYERDIKNFIPSKQGHREAEEPAKGHSVCWGQKWE